MSAAPAREAVSMIPGYVSPRARTRWLAALLVAIAVCGWFAVGFDLADLRLHARLAAGEAVGDLVLRSHELIRSTLAPLQAVLALAAFVAFVPWIHLARRNLRALGARRMRHSTGAAVWGCLIPGLNLWRPYRVLREVWRASDPGERDAFAWRQRRVPALLPAWWAATLAFAATGVLAAAMAASAGDDPPRRGLALGVELAADLAGAVAASLGYFVVVRIERAQETKHRQRDAGDPRPPADAGAGSESAQP